MRTRCLPGELVLHHLVTSDDRGGHCLEDRADGQCEEGADQPADGSADHRDHERDGWVQLHALRRHAGRQDVVLELLATDLVDHEQDRRRRAEDDEHPGTRGGREDQAREEVATQTSSCPTSAAWRRKRDRSPLSHQDDFIRDRAETEMFPQARE